MLKTGALGARKDMMPYYINLLTRQVVGANIVVKIEYECLRGRVRFPIGGRVRERVSV